MPCRSGVRIKLKVRHWRASSLEKSERLGLGVEGVERLGLARLPAARLLVAGKQQGGGRMLGIGEVAAADLEQPHGRCPAIEVAARSGEQAREQRRPHDLHVFADRIGQSPIGRPNAAASSSEMKLQVTASSSPRAAAARRTLRSIICERVAVGLATPALRGRGVEITRS